MPLRLAEVVVVRVGWHCLTLVGCLVLGLGMGQTPALAQPRGPPRLTEGAVAGVPRLGRRSLAGYLMLGQKLDSERSAGLQATQGAAPGLQLWGQSLPPRAPRQTLVVGLCLGFGVPWAQSLPTPLQTLPQQARLSVAAGAAAAAGAVARPCAARRADQRRCGSALKMAAAPAPGEAGAHETQTAGSLPAFAACRPLHLAGILLGCCAAAARAPDTPLGQAFCCLDACRVNVQPSLDSGVTPGCRVSNGALS